jgi:3-oxoacyl-(acyl-carrier-protein) synthase/NAD(P)H-dependent flavin oxidoreductase YrpB (nitropropane dioxygenase family)
MLASPTIWPDDAVLGALPPIIGITPFEAPDARLVIALARAGALGVLDLGRDVDKADKALAHVARHAPTGFGVRISAGVEVTALPAQVRVVVAPAGVPALRWRDRIVLAQVSSIDEARAALAQGAHGLIAKGNESGGSVGDEPSFILLQRILGEVSAPVWAQGGIGLHTAAACIAAGAKGVVLDAQLALLKESSAPAEVKRVIAAMDGSETRLVGGHRVYASPSAPAVAPDASPDEVAARLGASDPAVELLAAGQDAAFAKPLATRYTTADGLVRALRGAIVGHLRQARALEPLGRRSPLAAEHGITYPIAQGPMTRVSDRASFADAVSRGGGLPFLALSLMRGAEARKVLEETAALHRGRTWGVGVLGFVPPEIRDEQLAMLLEVRPTVALIAGGRPSHARPLEQAGIATYLHVPSPGLLDLFLKDGARRFVFEGRECGGHVGPRSSFVLWEAAIERLLAFDGLRDVSVLFAGGIHDARSGAMVSAMAAPLAARGAKVGVLMGTAYLFTEEAVATGAILPRFQQEAMRCERTVLLETAPGHATRCADTEFARAFEAERRRLEQEGKNKQEIWEALEQLNLGRLRIAAKGLRREGDQLVELDESEQRRDGMFMIGQVAALRSGRCTVAELHRDVSEGAVALLERAELAPPNSSKRRAADVAIVGMACIFPDAPNLAAFWKNVVLGVDAIREVPAERWNAELYFDPEGVGDRTPSMWGGFLPDTAFDPAAYGIPPRSLAAIDPVQLLSLEVARRALDDAGYGEREFDRERTSVIFGAEAGTELASGYGFRANYPQMLGALPEELDAHLPKLTEDSFAGVLANVIAGRIANRLDLGGVNYTVDAACASSLAAIDLACKELASGTSDMVIGGGADLHNSINDYLLFASVHALSPTGKCRTFDAKADGIALGEGVAALVLKRLADAERDGDRVYAVIKGVGGSSDGKSLGLTAPRKEGQMRALERAYDTAGISPADVGMVEAHGTGTVVGDRTELATLTEVFANAGALPGTCALG